MPVKIKFEDVVKAFERNDCFILSPPEDFKNSKSQLEWKCSCGKEQKSSLGTKTKALTDETYIISCRSCAIKRSKKAPSFDDFCEILNKEGWEMLSEEKEFVNTKSVMRVKPPDENECTTTYNRFQQGHRSKVSANNTFRHTQEKVEKDFADKGFVLLDKYKNKTTPLEYKCRCGNISKMRYENLSKNIVGCGKCAVDNRKVDWELIEEKFERAGCTLITQKEEYINNSCPIEYICYCGNEAKTGWKVFCLGGRCKECSSLKRKNTNMRKFGAENVFASDYGKEKIKEYYITNYGVEHNMQLEKCKEKAKNTSIDNNGVPYVFATEEIRTKARDAHILKYGAPPGFVEEIAKKQRDTCNKNWGTDYPFQSEKFREKLKDDMLEKYGTEHFVNSETSKRYMLDKYENEYFINSPELRRIVSEKYGTEHFVNSETSKKYMLDKYGNEYFINSPELRRRMLEKYDVEHALQSPQFLQKALSKAFSTKEYIFKRSGRKETIQGFEWLCLDYICESDFFGDVKDEDIVLGIDNIPVIDYMYSGSRKYFPDIYIPSKNILIEVKSSYTLELDFEKNIAKWEAAGNCGYDFYVFVYTDRKKLESVTKYTVDGEVRVC